MKKIDGHPSLAKNENGVILNTDYDAFVRAKERKKEKQKVQLLEERLERIENLLERLIKQ